MKLRIEPSGSHFLQGYQEGISRKEDLTEGEINIAALKLLAREAQMPLAGFIQLLGVSEPEANRVLGGLMRKEIAKVSFDNNLPVVTLTPSGKNLVEQFGWNTAQAGVA